MSVYHKDAETMDVPELRHTEDEDESAAPPLVETSSSDDDQATRSRRSPSVRSTLDNHGFPYLSVLPRPERRRIQLEIRRNKKLGN